MHKRLHTTAPVCQWACLHDAHAGHFCLEVQCNHVVYAQYICVVQAFLICSPCSPFTATSAHSSSLLPSLVAPASYPDCPPLHLSWSASHHSCLLCLSFPLHPWLYRLTDGPYRNWIATCLYMCISTSEWEEDMAWISLSIPLTIHIQSGLDYLSMGRKIEQVRRELITPQLEN